MSNFRRQDFDSAPKNCGKAYGPAPLASSLVDAVTETESGRLIISVTPYEVQTASPQLTKVNSWGPRCLITHSPRSRFA